MIYIIDTIGIHSGMKYFNESYQKIFNEQNIELKVLSNYKAENCIPILYNFYKGSPYQKIILLFSSYFKFLVYMLFHWHKNVFIYHSYGLRGIDILFIFPFCLSKRFFVEVHDVYSIHEKNKLRSLQDFFYKKMIKNVIIHSNETRLALNTIGFKGNVLYVPHLKYTFDKSYDVRNIKQEVKALFHNKKINFLFFGVIRESKGLDILIEALNNLPSDYQDKINLIIAGMDNQGIFDKLKLSYPGFTNYKILNRHIEDEELNYIFSNSDFIILPYKEIYQSGVMETAVYFKLPVISSDLKIFTDLFSKFKSFGYSFKLSQQGDLEKVITKVIDKQSSSSFYLQQEVSSYYQDEKTLEFINDFVELNQL